MVKYCPKCGTKLKDTDEYCINCGYNFNNRSINTETENKSNRIKNQENEKSKDDLNNFIKDLSISKKQIHMILGAIILVVVVIGVVSFVPLGQQYEITGVNQYIQHYADVGSTYKYVYSVMGDINNPPSDMKSYVIETKFYNTNGKLVHTDRRQMTEAQYDGKNGQFLLGTFTCNNRVEMDHVDITLLEGYRISGRTTYKFDMNKVGKVFI